MPFTIDRSAAETYSLQPLNFHAQQNAASIVHTSRVDPRSHEATAVASPSLRKSITSIIGSRSTSNASEIASRSASQPLVHFASNYVCSHSGCSEHFNKPAHLRQHLKQHKRYACDKCDAGYSHPKNLREHKQTKHLRLRYTCDVEGCNASMAQKKNLARHKTMKHGR